MMAAKPNILKCTSVVFFILLAICGLAGSAAANQKVVLVTGEVMSVDQAYVREGRVWITWNGLSLSIAEKDVLRIETNGKQDIIVQDKEPTSKPEITLSQAQNNAPGKIAARRKLQSKSLPAKQAAAGKSKPVSGTKKKPDSSEPLELTASAEQLLTYLEPDGFGDLKWGDQRKAEAGLKRLFKDSELPDVIEYVRPAESLRLGADTETAIIKYAFWKDRLYMVTVWASGPEAFHSIKAAMVNRFGQGIPKPDNPQILYWMDDNADRMIEYVQDKDLGLLWMRSREINNQYKLAQLRIPIRASQAGPALKAK